MSRRVSTRIAVYALSGVVITLGTSAALRTWSYRTLMYGSNGDGLYGVYTDREGFVIGERVIQRAVLFSRFGEECIRWEVEPIDPQSDEGKKHIGILTSFRDGDIRDGRAYLKPAQVQDAFAHAGALTTTPGKGFAVLVGWPVRCLRTDAIVPLLPDRFPTLLPLGFATDTVFYAGTLWGAVTACVLARRWNRRRRGLCERCGYDLRDQGSKGCPECGEGRVV